MGSAKSQDIKRGFDEVASKCSWKKGLIINILNKGQFVVVGLHGVRNGPPPGSLRTEEYLEGPVYNYLYVGDKVILTPNGTSGEEKFPAYEIIIKQISDAKIGGGTRRSS